MRRIKKDQKYRIAAEKFQLRRFFLKSIISNEFLPRVTREIAQKYLSASHNISKTKIVNRCKETSRARSVIRAFQLSRHRIRLHAESGFLLGVRRSSW
jgi:small subunit ribosomal protein S14